MMGLGPSCPPTTKDLKECNILGNSVLNENSKPFNDPDYGSFARKTLRHANLLEVKSIDCMAFNPICYRYLQEMSPAQLDFGNTYQWKIFWKEFLGTP
jgi:hypothetical protein